MELGLSYDDVLLLPSYSDVLPHQIDVSIELAPNIKLKVPILSAAMDTITESHMATALALNGGAGVIHRNLSIEAQAREVAQVKDSLSWIIKSPITISPKDNIRTARNIMEERSIGALPVVVDKVLVGLITKKDLMIGHTIANNETLISEVMVTNLITYQGANPTYDELSSLFKSTRVRRIPLIDSAHKLLGLVCINDFSKKHLYLNENAALDENKKLLVGAAVSPINYLERTQALIDAGANFIVIDSAHGNSKNVIDALKGLRATFPKLVLVAGNVATAGATKRLIESGADIVKVGMGPGSICTTRIVTGMGVPQFTAVKECAEEAKKMGKYVIADGGIRYSGDITKAIGIGAAAVMLGSLLAGLQETPGQTFNYNGKLYKRYRGMGSVSAINEGSGDRYQFSNGESIVPEGVDARISYKGELQSYLYQLVVGLKKGMGYCGCRSLKELMEYQKFIQITHAAMIESHVHDVIEFN